MLTAPELVWLMSAVAKGDQSAFERLYAATRAKLFGVALRILRRQDLAEEVIQETYVKIWASAGQYNPGAASPITWMVAIARNRAIDLVRKRTEVSIEEEPDAMNVAAESEDPLAKRQMTEELKRLLGCVGTLDPERQRLVLLAYYNGWSREELAAKLDKPVNTIKTWLRRSLLDIRECLGIWQFSEDHIALAAEYVLGTLDAAERAQAETMMSVDANFAALVQSWETRLGELHAMVDPVEPPAELWHRIRAATTGVGQSPPLRFEPLPDAAVAPDMASAAPRTTESQVVVLGQRMKRWRGVSAMTGALAAALALFIVTDAYRPDLLPKRLRRAPVQVVVTQPAPAPASQFVAVLQRDAASPAFIMTVDTGTKSFTVRRVGAEREAGKDYELWLVSDRFPGPRSLGVIGDADFTRAQLASFDQDTINAATYAVSVEPAGGSTTGAPTGPVVFSGKLVEAVPPAPAPVAPAK